MRSSVDAIRILLLCCLLLTTTVTNASLRGSSSVGEIVNNESSEDPRFPEDERLRSTRERATQMRAMVEGGGMNGGMFPITNQQPMFQQQQTWAMENFQMGNFQMGNFQMGNSQMGNFQTGNFQMGNFQMGNSQQAAAAQFPVKPGSVVHSANGGTQATNGGQMAPKNGLVAASNGQVPFAPANGQVAPASGQGSPASGQVAPANGSQVPPANGGQQAATTGGQVNQNNARTGCAGSAHPVLCNRQRQPPQGVGSNQAAVAAQQKAAVLPNLAASAHAQAAALHSRQNPHYVAPQDVTPQVAAEGGVAANHGKNWH